MDMLTSSISSLYDTTSTASTKQLEGALSTDYSSKTDEELMEACKDFEAYLYEQMFKSMRKMIPESEDEGSTSMLKEYFEDELYSQYAETLADQNETAGVGIAQTMYEQMKRNYNL